MLNLRDYLINNFDGKPSKTQKNEVSIDCPGCRHGDAHFSFNILKRKGSCFRCNYKVHSAVKLLQDVLNVSKEKALTLFNTGSVSAGRSDIALGILNMNNIVSSDELDDDSEHINADLPIEYINMYNEKRNPKVLIPKLFKIRNYSIETIKKMKIGFCKSGYYSCRIIFPIECNNMKSFYARRLYDWMSQKYKNPPKSKHSKLLYNYDNIPKNADIIFIVEGCTDVCRMTENNLYSVGTSGKKISTEQIQLLVDKNPNEVIALFDGDAIKANISLFKKLSYRLNSSFVELPDKGVDKTGKKIYYDPDDIPMPLLKSCIDKRIGMSRIKNTLNILNNL